MLTKSLHTVTSCTAVAMHLYRNPHRAMSTQPEDLAASALLVLGYPVSLSDLTDDTTVAACVKSVRKALAKVAA